MTDNSVDFAKLLDEVASGDAQAAADLLPLLYDELRQFAGRFLLSAGPGHMLQPTALVHEVFLRLIDQTHASYQNRAHFMALSSRIMRQILVDHARRHHAAKRGGSWHRVSLDQAVSDATPREIDVLALDEALKRLAELNPRHAQMVELRFLGGLTVEEAALVLGVSPRTVKADWRLAKAWLSRELRKDADQ